jgi:hypothetical protein
MRCLVLTHTAANPVQNCKLTSRPQTDLISRLAWPQLFQHGYVLSTDDGTITAVIGSYLRLRWLSLGVQVPLANISRLSGLQCVERLLEDGITGGSNVPCKLYVRAFMATWPKYFPSGRRLMANTPERESSFGTIGNWPFLRSLNLCSSHSILPVG